MTVYCIVGASTRLLAESKEANYVTRLVSFKASVRINIRRVPYYDAKYEQSLSHRTLPELRHQIPNRCNICLKKASARGWMDVWWGV